MESPFPPKIQRQKSRFIKVAIGLYLVTQHIHSCQAGFFDPTDVMDFFSDGQKQSFLKKIPQKDFDFVSKHSDQVYVMGFPFLGEGQQQSFFKKVENLHS